LLRVRTRCRRDRRGRPHQRRRYGQRGHASERSARRRRHHARRGSCNVSVRHAPEATMKPALVLSDLHLSATRPAPVEAFHAFARGPAQHASAVYILGDLFDWWLGDDQLADPLAASVAASIRLIADRGVPVFFARGNRYFLLSQRFEQTTGAQLLPDAHVVALTRILTLLLLGY